MLQKQPPEVFCKKKVFLEILQNSQENTCARVSFLIKLQAAPFSQNTSGRLLLSASMKVKDLEKKMERQVQYSRRNCISIHGLKEEKNKSTDDRVLKLFREELNEDVLLADSDRVHRIGKKKRLKQQTTSSYCKICAVQYSPKSF